MPWNSLQEGSGSLSTTYSPLLPPAEHYKQGEGWCSECQWRTDSIWGESRLVVFTLFAYVRNHYNWCFYCVLGLPVITTTWPQISTLCFHLCSISNNLFLVCYTYTISNIPTLTAMSSWPCIKVHLFLHRGTVIIRRLQHSNPSIVTKTFNFYIVYCVLYKFNISATLKDKLWKKPYWRETSNEGEQEADSNTSGKIASGKITSRNG